MLLGPQPQDSKDIFWMLLKILLLGGSFLDAEGNVQKGDSKDRVTVKTE